MKITLHSTDRLVMINGTQARIWEGESAHGVPVVAAIATIAVHKDADNSEFERELREHKPASDNAIAAFQVDPRLERRPIDTAPKDGSPIMLIEDGHIWSDSWNAEFSCWDVASDADPTHWMPYPFPQEFAE